MWGFEFINIKSDGEEITVGHPNLVELLEPHWTGPQEASKKDLMGTCHVAETKI